jgi:hypothetical protein
MHDGGDLVADGLAELGLGLRDGPLVGAQPQPPGGGEHDPDRPRVVPSAGAHQAPGGALVDQLAHGLLGDAGMRAASSVRLHPSSGRWRVI